jgi:oxysterol-binding protein 1
VLRSSSYLKTCSGNVQVKFHDGEVLSWNKVTTTINNLILGKIYVDFAGTMRVRSNIHSNEMRVKFKDTGSMFGASKRSVSGSSFEGNVERPNFRCG